MLNLYVCKIMISKRFFVRVLCIMQTAALLGKEFHLSMHKIENANIVFMNHCHIVELLQFYISSIYTSYIIIHILFPCLPLR